MGILFAKVTGYEISGFTIEETQCWAISQEACSHGRVHDIEFRNSNIMRNQDGVDVRKGCHDIVIENITGVCGDDVVALTALRRPEGTTRAQGKVDCEITGCWPTPDDDVFNVTVRNIRAKCAGGHGLIRLLVQDGIKMHHVTVSNIVHTAGEGDVLSHAAIRIGDERYWSISKCELGDMHDITVSDVFSKARAGILISGPLSDSSVTGITVPRGTPKYKITSCIENVRLDKER
jgi:polygalacturonase